MLRKTRSVKGRVNYFKRPYILHMKQDKPTVYKIQICRGRVVKESDFIAYAAQAAHVPETTMITAKNAIFQAINYFVLNGHAVQLEGLGSFSPRIKSKTTQNIEDVSAELITRKYIKFNPSGDVQALCAAENISFEENKALTKQYMNQFAFRLREHEGTKYLVSMDGKLCVSNDAEGNMFFYVDAPTATAEEKGWHMDGAIEDLEAWGTKPVSVETIYKTVDGQQVADYLLIKSGDGELKMTIPTEEAGGTLSPMPFAYFEAVDD